MAPAALSPSLPPTETTPPARRTTFLTETRVKVSCGCGQRFDSLEEGRLHAAWGHTLNISGEIRPLKF